MTKAASDSPHPCPRVVPKLVVDDADAAIRLYEKVFGATQTQRYAIGTQVVYAEVDMLGGLVELKDADEHDPSPTSLGRPGVLMAVTHPDPDGVVDAMVAAGGEIVFAVGDQPYGARGGRVRDPFGHEWLVQTPITMSPKEIQDAMERLS